MLETKIVSVVKACTGKFGKNEIKQKQLDDFKFELKQFYNKFNALNENETEEHFKNIFRDFLLKAFYENKNYINTKSFAGLFGSDMVIHETADVNSRVEVLLEFKRPTNKSGMITTENLNKKAMFEAVLYYLQERMENNNIELKYIIVTNLVEFFIFDAKQFRKLFYENSITEVEISLKEMINYENNKRNGKVVREDLSEKDDTGADNVVMKKMSHQIKNRKITDKKRDSVLKYN